MLYAIKVLLEINMYKKKPDRIVYVIYSTISLYNSHYNFVLG